MNKSIERVLFMIRLFTAVGRLHVEGQRKGGKIPVVILRNREYILDIQEFVLWSALNWRILRPDQIQNLYREKELETGFCSSRSFDDCMCRLIQRGLVAEGNGETDAQALYRLLSDLYIMPISENPLLRLYSFFRLCVFGNAPYSAAKKILHKDKRTADEKKVVHLAGQALLSTAEIVKCFERNKLDFCCEEELLDTLYCDEFTTSDNIADEVSCLPECRPVIDSVANLYLRKQIIFERI